MATERGNLFLSDLKARNDFRSASRDQAKADWKNSYFGTGGTTPLSEFQSNKNTRYAMENVGWNKAQDLRRKAVASDTEAAAPPPGRWERRYNHVTGEMEWREKESSNFWKANKNELIQVGGALAGGLVGTLLLPGLGTMQGAMLGRSLAKTGRDLKVLRDARRDVKDDKREWEYQQMLDAQEAERYGPKSGNLFKNIGEGTVEWATKDVERNKRKGTYERGAV